MKDAIDSISTERPVEQEGFANRKLIRPSLNRNDHNHSHGNPTQAPMERRERSDRLGGALRPPEIVVDQGDLPLGKTPLVEEFAVVHGGLPRRHQ